MNIKRKDKKIECYLENKRVGYIDYSIDEVIIASFIYVEPNHRNTNAKDLLLEELMNMSNELGLKINATCGYMNKFFTRNHPEYLI
ncbi:N-acetyltransferase [Mycoplasmatota bacterium]|nr:N-acetyltransferase [Mycoplasmatota bacterium]